MGILTASRFTPTAATDENVLLNPGFEDGSFVKYYPNHYVAASWNRWWIHGTNLPEFTDAGWSREPYEGNHAQIYHSLSRYTAGIFQVVDDLTPCRPYELTMYTKTHAEEGTQPHSRMGLDPYGTHLTDDGAVKQGLPPATIWSEEQVSLLTWESLSVKAEPIGDKLTVILYAAPGPGSVYYETYWDSGALVPSSYDGGRLPEPAMLSDFIYDVNVVTGTTSITVSWHTTEPPAATQVWYNVFTPASPVTPTTTMTHTAYLPLISRGEEPFAHATGISFMRATQHQALINGFAPGQGIRFIIVARRLNGDVCETVRSERWTVLTQGP
ncbi:MAG: hypothetical protein ACP5HM_13335 [Anaerolineae bacterium]